MSSEYDLVTELESTLQQQRKPCGCGGAKASSASLAGASLGDVQQELAAALAAESLAAPGADQDNPFADLEPAMQETEAASLEGLLRLAERTPGLKITISFDR